MDRHRSGGDNEGAASKKAMGERIAQERREMSARLRRDVTRAEVAQAIGVDGGTVTKWENGEVAPRDDALIRLASFFGVTRGWLRWGELPREAPQPERLPPTQANHATLAGENSERHQSQPPRPQRASGTRRRPKG